MEWQKNRTVFSGGSYKRRTGFISRQDVIDRVRPNAYEVLIEGAVSMRECHGKIAPGAGEAGDGDAV